MTNTNAHKFNRFSIAGYTVLQDGEMFIDFCHKCAGTGVWSRWGTSYSGQCFTCKGAGLKGEWMDYMGLVAWVENEERKATNREKSRARKDAKQDAWRADNAEILARVDAVLEERHHDFLQSLWNQAVVKPWTPNQLSAVIKVLNALEPQIAARNAARAANAEAAAGKQHVATVGTRVRALTATVTRVVDLDGFYGPSRVVSFVLDDENMHEVVTIGGGETLFGLEVDQVVKVTGTVKGYSEFDGVPQTKLTRVVIGEPKAKAPRKPKAVAPVSELGWDEDIDF